LGVVGGDGFGEFDEFDVEVLGGVAEQVEAASGVRPRRVMRMPLAWPMTSRESMALRRCSVWSWVVVAAWVRARAREAWVASSSVVAWSVSVKVWGVVA